LKNDAEVVLFNYTVETVNDCVVVREWWWSYENSNSLKLWWCNWCYGGPAITVTNIWMQQCESNELNIDKIMVKKLQRKQLNKEENVEK
jgi:hypothetical protein